MRLLIYLLFGLSLIACSKDKDSAQQSNFKRKADDFPPCQAAQLKQQFLVVWKDGSISREYAVDRESFINDFMEENKEYIEFAENDYLVEFPPVGKDADVNLSAIDNWGVARIAADQAWQMGARGQNITVAVVDSGVDVNHPDLSQQIAHNENEIPGNGIDDDGNGYIDDYSGYSYITHDDDVAQSSLHGSHVSGIIAAQHDDNEIMQDKVQGIAPRAKLIPLKFIDADGGGLVSDAIDAIDYAVLRGAKVINASWGGGCSESLKVKMDQLTSEDVLFIAAAGNSAKNIDKDPEFPAAYATAAMITVGAITRFNGMADFSNYGDKRVHLFAPGESIISTAPGNRYISLDGTSMAAPFVSGAAAALWSDQPQASAQQIKQALLEAVDIEYDNNNIPTYHNVTQGRLNLGRAIEILRNL
ncbi:MAG: S8 family serine peptidase [Bdellovibrionales bacterium]|nr:S8 family serine peptidase [Bdellovibrionales bacterium]